MILKMVTLVLFFVLGFLIGAKREEELQKQITWDPSVYQPLVWHPAPSSVLVLYQSPEHASVFDWFLCLFFNKTI